MARIQKRAEAMMEDIKKREDDLEKLNIEVEMAKEGFTRTMINSDILSRDMMKLEKQLTGLRQKEQMLEKTNTKLNIIQKR